MPITPLRIPDRFFGQPIPVAPDMNQVVDKVDELVAAVNAGLATSNAIVGGNKFVQYTSSQTYGVPADALTLDRLDPATILPGVEATVINPHPTPLTDTAPSAYYRATIVPADTAGAVLVPAFTGSPDKLPIAWVEVVSNDTFTPLLANELNPGKAAYAGLELRPLLIALANGVGTGTTTVVTTPATAPTVTGPTVTGFLPASAAVGASVTLTGTGFTKATAVLFNGTPASFQPINATTLVAVVPVGATTGPVAVTNSADTGTSAASFTVGASTTTPTPTPELTAALAISLATLTLGASVSYSVTPAKGTAPYAYEVVATDTSTGQQFTLGTTKTGNWTPTAVGSYAIEATVTDSSSPVQIAQSAIRYLQVVQATNRIPVADAGTDLTVQLPTSSAALMGRATDPDGDAITAHAWRQITGPSTATGMPATSQNVLVSNLVAGTYQFGYRATDSRGGQSDEDYVLVTALAVTGSADKIYWAAIGNSIDTPGGSDIADPVYIDSAYQQLGSPANLELHHYGYPGKTLQWIVDNRLPAILAEIKAARDGGQYTKCVVTLHEGENGLFVYDADTAYNTTVSVCGQLKALSTGSFPVPIGLVPVVNRVSGAGLPGNYNGQRTTYNSRLRSNWSTFADFFVEPTNQLSVWGDDYPLNYPNVYCSDGTHPTTEGARIMGVELAQTMRPFVGVGSITPAYVKNIGYTPPATGGGGTTPVAQILPESRTYSFAQMSGPGVAAAADYSEVHQVGYGAGDFGATAIGSQVAQIVAGQRWVNDFEFTILQAGNEHVIGLIQASSLGNDGDIEVRLYPQKASGQVRVWINVVGGNVNKYNEFSGIADNDKILFRVYTDVFEIYQNGNLLVSIPRETGDTRFFHPAIAFGNAGPGDTIVVRQRGLKLVTG